MIANRVSRESHTGPLRHSDACTYFRGLLLDGGERFRCRPAGWTSKARSVRRCQVFLDCRWSCPALSDSDGFRISAMVTPAEDPEVHGSWAGVTVRKFWNGGREIGQLPGFPGLLPTSSGSDTGSCKLPAARMAAYIVSPISHIMSTKALHTASDGSSLSSCRPPLPPVVSAALQDFLTDLPVGRRAGGLRRPQSKVMTILSDAPGVAAQRKASSRSSKAKVWLTITAYFSQCSMMSFVTSKISSG